MTRTTRGRPPASSREMLQEAAFELFLEQTYAGTSIDEIASRAGVSRNTFFNYFRVKSDVFWVDLDGVLARLAEELALVPAGVPAMRGLVEAIIRVGRGFGPSLVPFALTQAGLIGSMHELQAAGLLRLTEQARVMSAFLAARMESPDRLRADSAANATLGAAIAAGVHWAGAGTGRGALEPYLAQALDPVLTGFDAWFVTDDRRSTDQPSDQTRGAPSPK